MSDFAAGFAIGAAVGCALTFCVVAATCAFAMVFAPKLREEEETPIPTQGVFRCHDHENQNNRGGRPRLTLM